MSAYFGGSPQERAQNAIIDAMRLLVSSMDFARFPYLASYTLQKLEKAIEEISKAMSLISEEYDAEAPNDGRTESRSAR